MQYLLTANERAELVPKEQLDAANRAIAWCFKQLQPKGCPLRPENSSMAYPYCDNCLIEQSWHRNSDGPSRDTSRLVCTLNRQHSK